ncbi:MAG TPA: HesA/MoeB/ThiF family protein [Anaeromyxobacteraceae bacterium]|nr:HesA/MoeB/ThiF family protein [Anaeromyxobacteraceae bacterium]
MGELSGKSVLVVGAGGLGGPALLALGAAGVGRLVIFDDDVVETSNLNRQPLFGEGDVGRRKAGSAATRLRRQWPSLRVDAHDRRFDASCALEAVRSVDVVVDGSDNFETKFLASDAAVEGRRPLVHGGVLRYTAQFLTVMPGQTGCLRCLFEGPPEPGTVPTCAQAGIVGALAGFAGALMGAEALRLLAGERGAYAGRLVVYEARPARTRIVPVRTRAGCPACEGRLAVGGGPGGGAA